MPKFDFQFLQFHKSTANFLYSEHLKWLSTLSFIVLIQQLFSFIQKVNFQLIKVFSIKQLMFQWIVQFHYWSMWAPIESSSFTSNVLLSILCATALTKLFLSFHCISSSLSFVRFALLCLVLLRNIDPQGRLFDF